MGSCAHSLPPPIHTTSFSAFSAFPEGHRGSWRASLFVLSPPSAPQPSHGGTPMNGPYSSIMSKPVASSTVQIIFERVGILAHVWFLYGFEI